MPMTTATTTAAIISCSVVMNGASAGSSGSIGPEGDVLGLLLWRFLRMISSRNLILQKWQ